ncbi:hypothetical protein B6U45_00775 [Ligilactobacillus salivarius]|nr:hypothetical protein B6U45_00775 [Ligilactobacillus salivarius]
MANKLNSFLAHTKRLCKYHIVFTPKYRRKIIYYQYRKDLRLVMIELFLNLLIIISRTIFNFESNGFIICIWSYLCVKKVV